ncbi:MAG TPA: hypothetical protein VH722_05545, partial [Alphaproteobacteria bacterium]|nr:hypothetical protein [Alphaproteobacteria bacterium]
FHAGDIPASAVPAQADAAIREIAGALSSTPRPHRNHPYWAGGLALHRATTGGLSNAEFGYRPGWNATALKWRLRLLVSGRPPAVRPWHPRAPDFARARKALAGADRVLIVADEPRSFAHWLRPTMKDVTALSAGHVLDRARSELGQGFDACLMVLSDEKLGSGASLVAAIAPALKPDGKLTILVTGAAAAEASFFCPPDIERAVGTGGWDVAYGCVEAGPVRRAVQQRMVRTMRAAQGSRPAMLPFHAIAWAGLAVLSYLCNLAVRSPGGADGWCSSVVLTLYRTQPAADRAAAPVHRNPTGLMALCAIS